MDKETAEALLKRYTVRMTEVKHPQGWSCQDVDIMFDDQKIGGYQRNYPTHYSTFVPFVQGESVYALYAPDYTSTRLMRLPDCVDLGGEERLPCGFCPVDYFVPYDPVKGLTGQWGFIAGCIWGDDSSWKIQYLDLSEAAQGMLRREERFGHLEIDRKMSLREAINMGGYHADSEYSMIGFRTVRRFLMKLSRYYEGINDEIEQ